jgi:hypothetical protein
MPSMYSMECVRRGCRNSEIGSGNCRPARGASAWSTHSSLPRQRRSEIRLRSHVYCFGLLWLCDQLFEWQAIKMRGSCHRIGNDGGAPPASRDACFFTMRPDKNPSRCSLIRIRPIECRARLTVSWFNLTAERVQKSHQNLHICKSRPCFAKRGELHLVVNPPVLPNLFPIHNTVAWEIWADTSQVVHAD